MAKGRCDHDPAAPRLGLRVEPIGHQPWFNREAQTRAKRLYFQPRLFPELTGHSIAGRTARIRERRSSRREAWVLMAKSIARHTDRRTFRIGDQRDDGLCNGISIARYQAETGLSRWRVASVLREFEQAGFIVTHDQPVEKVRDHREGCDRKGCACPVVLDDDGKERHRGFPAQRQATPLLFERLGYTKQKVKKARAAGYDAWCRRRAPALSAAAILGTRRALRKLGAGAGARPAGGGAAAAPAPARPPADPERLDRANAEREARLAALSPPDTRPPVKPPGSR